MTHTGAATYDGFVVTTGDELWDRVHQAHRRFAALLSVTPPRTEVAGSDWTAGEVAGHVLTVLRRYTRRDLDSSEGLSPDPNGVAGINAVALEDLELTNVAEVLDCVWRELADLERILPRSTDLNRRYPFHSGQQVDAAGWLGNLIGEFLVHGHDVARARGKAWKIGSRNAALALNVVIQAAPGYVSPDAPGDLRLEVRTPETRPWVIDLADGEAVSRAATGEPVDVRLFARTEPLLLNLYGRRGIVRTTLHGAAVVGGRRPWRVTRLGSSFLTP